MFIASQIEQSWNFNETSRTNGTIFWGRIKETSDHWQSMLLIRTRSNDTMFNASTPKNLTSSTPSIQNKATFHRWRCLFVRRRGLLDPLTKCAKTKKHWDSLSLSEPHWCSIWFKKTASNQLKSVVKSTQQSSNVFKLTRVDLERCVGPWFWDFNTAQIYCAQGVFYPCFFMKTGDGNDQIMVIDLHWWDNAQQ